jgi:hypothetical protein
MGSPEHLNGKALELGHGKEASMLFVAGSGTTSGPEVCAFTIWWVFEAFFSCAFRDICCLLCLV